MISLGLILASLYEYKNINVIYVYRRVKSKILLIISFKICNIN